MKPKINHFMYKPALLICSVILMTSCQTVSPRNHYAIPNEVLISDHVTATSLSQWLELALKYNPILKQANEKRIQAQLVIEDRFANRLPDLKIGLDSGRRQTTASITESNNLTTTFSWELDWIGKLSNAEQQAIFAFEQANASAFLSQQTVLKQVAQTYLNTVQAKALLEVYQQREILLTQQLQMLEENYQLGLTSALDVYLARSNLASEQSRVVNQLQVVKQSVLLLQSSVGILPSKTELTLFSPTLQKNSVEVVTSEQLLTRPDVSAAWYELLAANEATAVAFKAQFPSFKLSVSGGYSSEEFKSLLKGDFLWSWVANLSQPLFDGGRLANEFARVSSNERVALAKLQDVMNKAYGDIDVELARSLSIEQRFTLANTAFDNAQLAQTLSFSQYQKGLVTFTTVLDAQKRALDAQVNVISLQTEKMNQLIDLETALGRPLTAFFALTMR
ncbi:outer membrane transport protein [Pseudoalteromonas luteoviolacea B = ATCC 29581]|nr:outer membrane transport protein [Pseudoalteromonas luteoviolacea B = ATCC 29581]